MLQSLCVLLCLLHDPTMPPVLAKPADCSPNAPVIIDLIVSESEEESPQPPRLKRYKACTHRASFLASARLGISPKEYRQLRRWNIPKDYLQLLCYHHVEFGSSPWRAPLLGRCQPSKATTQKAPGTLGVEESSSP